MCQNWEVAFLQQGDDAVAGMLDVTFHLLGSAFARRVNSISSEGDYGKARGSGIQRWPLMFLYERLLAPRPATRPQMGASARGADPPLFGRFPALCGRFPY